MFHHEAVNNHMSFQHVLIPPELGRFCVACRVSFTLEQHPNQVIIGLEGSHLGVGS